MNKIGDNYIDLKRLYRRYRDDENSNSMMWNYNNKSQYLDEIIQSNQFVVILGDKGAGKTTEIRHLLKEIEEQKGFSFFFKLDDLASANFCLSPKYEQLHSQWMDSEDKCTVFLDSIDECRLNNSFTEDNFEKALARFLQIFKINNKCSFIITCRESDWKIKKDEELIKKLLYLPIKPGLDFDNDFSKQVKIETQVSSIIDDSNEEKTTEIDAKWIYVCEILPLEQHQIEKIAEKYKIENSKEFIECLKNNLIPYSFYNTPIECIDTINHFKRYGSVPKKISDFLHHKLFFRYRELNENYRNGLTLKKIEDISKRLATATALCRKPSILVTESYSTYYCNSDATSELGNSLSLRDLFPDEDERVLQHYIKSMLFSSNGENQVKFYNEYVKNYVVYLWFKDRIERNRFQGVRNLLFQRVNGEYYPRESLIIPIVMLAEKEYDLRKLLIKNTPELLIKYSQYCCLSDVERIDVLKNVFNNHYYQIMELWGYGNDVEMSLYYFANDCLINEFKHYYNSSDFDGKAFLISLLKYISLDKIDNDIKEALWNTVYDSAMDDLKSKALSVLLRFEDANTISKLEDLLRNKRDLLRDITFYKILKALYPKYINLQNCISLFLADEENKKYWDAYRDDMFFLEQFINDAYNVDNSSIILIINKVDEARTDTNINKFMLLYAYAICLEILLKDRRKFLSKQEIAKFLVSLQVELKNIEGFDEHSKSQLLEKVKKLCPLAGTEIINLFYKHYFKEEQITLKDFKHLLWDIGEKEYLFSFKAEHLKYTENFYNKLSDTDRKDVLDSIIVQFENYNNFKEIIAPFIKRAEDKKYCDDCVAIRKENLEKYKKRANKPDKYCSRENKLMKKNKEFLLKNLDALANGENIMFNAMLNISYQYMDDDEVDLKRIEKDFGEDVAQAYKKGVEKYWTLCNINNYQDYLEQIGKNKVLNNSIIALAGIPFYLAENNCVLNKDIVKRIIYFGCQSLNKFPKWFEDIVYKFPSEAKEIIMSIVYKVFEVEDSDYTFIDKLSRLDKNLLNLFYDDIWNSVEKKQIISTKVLKSTIKMLLIIPSANKEKIANIINDKIDYLNWENSMDWLNILFFLNGDMFYQNLNQYEKGLDSDTFKKFFTSLLSYLERGYYFSPEKANIQEEWKELDNLAKLVPMVCKYITVDEDIHHEGVYSPNDRDNAQYFRSSLINIVGSKKYAKEDRSKLIKIANDLAEGWHKNYFLRIADKILVDDTDIESLKEKDIIDFENGDDLPANCAEDLFKIVCNKLDDIKSDIELSDYSIKELYHHLSISQNKKESDKIKKEEYFQRYMLKEMRFLAKKLYSSIREPEVNDNKKPDIQVWEKCWCINIECKIADSWSFCELTKAIEKQLVGQYLKHPSCQYGVLLLANMKEKRRWKIKNKNFSFGEIVQELQKIADMQYLKFSHIKEIKVIGIKYY